MQNEICEFRTIPLSYDEEKSPKMVSPTSKSRLTIAIENDPNDECGGGGLASPFEAPAPFSFINKSYSPSYNVNTNTTISNFDDFLSCTPLAVKNTQNCESINGLRAQVILSEETNTTTTIDSTCSEPTPIYENDRANFNRRSFCGNLLNRQNSRGQLDPYCPERIFKIVLVGDSAVGKTCVLHRFCYNRFKPLFSATIGVDFTVKTMTLDDRIVALQLWDTAGQERFRSITKQYFRKADGVILMYDVTSETSFVNVRNWIESVRNGVDDGCILCLVGNKVDLYPNEQSRTITFRHGKDLADEFGLMFFETSAFTGQGIKDCMETISMRLQEREDEHVKELIKLEALLAKGKQGWCCF
ncbi:Ras and EF-hand domain-containing protein [Meloidogyne graminicola]|uniref:Ras and EF-hand domain-containing protein n=1 Tax=Meloidogyne graminicola TaxID=189291 RepID=A0A8S9ZFC7_9BILA|nr:Ras and EF-hand domain-containing protein [Meloidogyne graminicola]